MYRFFLGCLIFCRFGLMLEAQPSILVREKTGVALPGVQAFAVGRHDGLWLIVGGRIDGLHRRQPWATFLPEGNNKHLMVINPENGQFWSATLDSFPPELKDQLQSTNINFVQVGDYLFLAGGYGYGATAGQHVTHPILTRVYLPGTIAAVKNAGNPAAHFEYVTDEQLRVTGGQLGYLDGVFYLMGGQKFTGRYNPIGPNHGPGFEQAYTNAVRRFTVADPSSALEVNFLPEWTDADQLHRRDFNAVAQVFPDGSRGFTLFSGVFRPDADLPWLNTVDLRADGYFPKPDFNQFLNQYHTAHVGLYDDAKNTMFTVFFGGISRYYFLPDGQLADDPNVPFVRTISMVSRDADGKMSEFQTGSMPDLLGASAEFIPALDEDEGLIRLNELSGSDSVLLGHVYGGIQSTAPNIFFTNEGDQSLASGRVFEVWWKPAESVAVQPAPARLPDRHRLKVYPNPANHTVNAGFEAPIAERLQLQVYSSDGRLLRTVFDDAFEVGVYTYTIDLSSASPGVYYFQLRNVTGVCSETTLVRE